MATPQIQQDGQGVYLISGELLMQTVPDLAQRAIQLLAGAGGEVIIDLVGVDRTDSAGLALLMELQRVARRGRFAVRFRNLPDPLRQIVHLSELDEIVPIVS